MPDLAAAPTGAFPLRSGGIAAVELPRAPLHVVAPRRGAAFTVPDPGTWSEADGVRTYWFALGQAAVLGDPPDAPGCAVFDQTDAWCRVLVSGPGADDVLARLVPVDSAALVVGTCARTQVGHMNGLVARTPEGVELWVFRSMAGTLAHDLDRAMRHVAARRAHA